LDKVYQRCSYNSKNNRYYEVLFQGLENEFEVGRYHSWVVDATLPDVLEATSLTKMVK
jgi:anthranilate synthase component 2